MNKIRLDVALFERGLVQSREKAKTRIKQGAVTLSGSVCDKPSALVAADAQIALNDTGCPYVSRGGYKLEKALRVFKIDVRGKTALDIGASTGGFTDCLLTGGAKKVYSIDAGTDQLADKLRRDSRVAVYEKTNFRYFDKSEIEDIIDIVVMDVSFISITKLCGNLKNFIDEKTELVFLIKPQFESLREEIGKNGVITDGAIHKKTLKSVSASLVDLGYNLISLDYSPIKGPKGNIEFLGRFTLSDYNGNNDEMIEKCVESAHDELIRKEN